MHLTTRADAIREALRIVEAERCAKGQHIRGCVHRPDTTNVFVPVTSTRKDK